MRHHRQHQLYKELRSAGSDESEIAQLLPIATDLRTLKHAETATSSIGRRRLITFAACTAASLAFVACFAMIAQTVLPTSRLYPLQKFSDTLAMDIHPNYRATVMMRRADQVDELVAAHASSNTTLATLANYSTVASVYKTTPHASYAAFEYCEVKLRQASASAPPKVRTAIASSLYSLESS